MSLDEKPQSEFVETVQDDGHAEITVTWRTHAAVASFVFLQIFQVWSLFGVAFSATYIATELDALPLVHWSVIVTSLGQARPSSLLSL
ncbi:hypothetical protein RQP46_011434 [Phenoliferia psychrophenolica]